jgi:hypothetical protein
MHRLWAHAYGGDCLLTGEEVYNRLKSKKAEFKRKTREQRKIMVEEIGEVRRSVLSLKQSWLGSQRSHTHNGR